jgi:hypothetical protein
MKNHSLIYNGLLQIDNEIYDRYEIILVEWDLITNIFSIKVKYVNLVKSKVKVISYPLDVKGDVVINDAIELIHKLNEKYHK